VKQTKNVRIIIIVVDLRTSLMAQGQLQTRQ
jgi:hypothetical protein